MDGGLFAVELFGILILSSDPFQQSSLIVR